MQVLGGSSTTAPVCQQKPQLSPPVECDCIDLTTSDSSVAAAADPEDMNELSSLLVLYNHDLDRVQRHLEGALQHTQTQQDQLQLSRMAQLEARKQVRFSFRPHGLSVLYGLMCHDAASIVFLCTEGRTERRIRKIKIQLFLTLS